MNKKQFDNYYINYPKTMYVIDIPEHMIINIKKLLEKTNPIYYKWLIWELEELIDEYDIEEDRKKT